MNGNQPGTPGMPQMPGPVQPPMMAPPAAPAAPALAPPVAVPPPMAAGGPPVVQTFDLDMAAIRRQAEDISVMMQGRKRQSDFASFKNGLNFIRILPPWSQEVAAGGQFAKYHMTHFNILEKQSCSCWESSLPNFGFKCPICHIRATYGRYMGDALSESEPRGYHYANAIVYDSPDNGASFLYKRLKPYVLRLPATVWTGLMQMMNQPYVGNITSVDTGWIVAVIKPESFKGKATYTWQHVVSGPLGADQSTTQSILADMHNLDTFGDFGIPTVEKLQRQFQLAEAMLQSCVQATQWQPEQVPGFGSLELVIPDVVYQVHGQQAAVVGMAGSAPPAAPQMGAPQMAAPVGVPAAGVPVQAAVPAPQPAAAPVAPPAAAPALAQQGLPMTPPPGGIAPGGFPGMPGSAPAPMPGAPMAGMPGAAMPPPPAAPTLAPPPPPAPMPGAPAMAMPAAPAPMMPAVGPAPMPGAPMPSAPMPGAQMPSAPMPGAPMPSAPMPGVPGGTAPPPFPPAPAPQQETSPTSGAGETQEKKKKTNDKVKCPGCGKDYSGKRGLKVHMNKSEACQKAATEPPPEMSAVAQPAAAPASAAAPAGMAPPTWPEGQTGPLPPT